MRKLVPLLLLPALLMPPASAATTPIPQGVPGLVLWFNAAQMKLGDVPANGRWIGNLDTSGKEFLSSPAPVATGAQSAFNGMPAFVFDGSGPFFKAPVDIRGGGVLGGEITVFGLYSYRGTYGGSGVFGNDNSNWDRFFLAHIDDRAQCVSNALPVAFCLDIGGTANGRHLVAIRYTRVGSSSVFLDGVRTNFTDGSSRLDARADFIIGADGDNSPLTGQVAEVLVYKRYLTDSEIQRVTDYLKAKYGLI